jgi:hypothetical protein
MSSGNIYITLVRPGKPPTQVEASRGSTVRQVLDKAGIPSTEYANWSFTDEDGDTLGLDSSLDNSTALICGTRVDGAIVAVLSIR